MSEHEFSFRDKHGDISAGGRVIQVEDVDGIKSKNSVGAANMKTVKAEAIKTDGSASLWAGAMATNHDNVGFSAGAKAGASIKDGNHEFCKSVASVDAEVGQAGGAAGANLGATIYKYQDSIGVLNVASGKVDGAVGFVPGGGVKAKLDAGIDLINVKVKVGPTQSVETNLGLNVDTGVEARDGSVSASVAGVGITLGQSIGIKTPFGGFKIKLW